ncbi:MAG: penicillin-binding protein 2 [Actinomycetota bacterium]|nr:penicillin-binding protein 2 [Actinomycetota bacterium]
MRPINDLIQKRLFMASMIVTVIFGLLFFRLWTLQVVARDEYVNLSNNNRIRTVTTSAPRGNIYDRSGLLLANNLPTLAVTVDYQEINNEEMLAELAKILNMKLAAVRERVNDKKYAPFYPRIVKQGISKETASYIKENSSNLPGVDITTNFYRNYPKLSLAPHVIGYIGEISQEELAFSEALTHTSGDLIGKSGIEGEYEEILCGTKGIKQFEIDRTGSITHMLDEREPVAGNHVQLTIDSALQSATESSLKSAVMAARANGYPDANGGAAIVLNPNNGEILALASYPTYDQTLFVRGMTSREWESLNAKGSGYPLFNRAVMASYAPASVFKPVTYVAGLSDGVVSAKDSFLCEGTWLGMGEMWPKNCWRKEGHGETGFTAGLKDSCDVVFYEVGYRLYKRGGERLQHWSRKFGFGKATGVDLPSEVIGRVPDRKWKKETHEDLEEQKWLPGDTVNLAIGQGDLLTSPLQVADLYAAIANDGLIWKPHVVSKVFTPEGDEIRTAKRKKLADIDISKDVLDGLKKGLVSVIKEGTASNAFAGFPVPVAGKTGTSEVKGRDDFAWFACFAPVNNPKYVVVVMVEEGGHGGSIAAPAARRILSTAFNVSSVGPVSVSDDSR